MHHNHDFKSFYWNEIEKITKKTMQQIVDSLK